jgi:hypothetical protein
MVPRASRAARDLRTRSRPGPSHSAARMTATAAAKSSTPTLTAIIRRTALVTSPSTRSGRFRFPPAGQWLPASANPACRRASASRPTCSSRPRPGRAGCRSPPPAPAPPALRPAARWWSGCRRGRGEVVVAVVVADVVVGDGVGVFAEAEVSPGHDPWLPRSSGRGPRLLDGRRALLEHGQPEQRGYPSLPMGDRSPVRRRDQPSEQQRRPPFELGVVPVRVVDS